MTHTHTDKAMKDYKLTTEIVCCMASGLTNSVRSSSATSIGPRGDPFHIRSLSSQQSATSASPFSQRTHSCADSRQPSDDSVPSPLPSPQVLTLSLLSSSICALLCIMSREIIITESPICYLAYFLLLLHYLLLCYPVVDL